MGTSHYTQGSPTFWHWEHFPWWFLHKNLQTGHIQHSKSFTNGLPFFFIKTKDTLSNTTENVIKNKHLLPLISELVNHLRGLEVFTKFNVRWGYNNIQMKEGDKWKAVFRTNRGLFEPMVMFFSLTDSPIHDGSQTWSQQERSSFTLTTLTFVPRQSKTLENHRGRVKDPNSISSQRKVKSNRMIWGLGTHQRKDQNGSHDNRAIAEWSTLMKLMGPQQFLGFFNFYRQFICNYSKITKPLTTLTGRVPWTWGEKDGLKLGDFSIVWSQGHLLGRVLKLAVLKASLYLM